MYKNSVCKTDKAYIHNGLDKTCLIQTIQEEISDKSYAAMGSVNGRRRYTVLSALIGWVHTQNDPCSSDTIHPCRIKLFKSDVKRRNTLGCPY